MENVCVSANLIDSNLNKPIFMEGECESGKPSSVWNYEIFVNDWARNVVNSSLFSSSSADTW